MTFFEVFGELKLGIVNKNTAVNINEGCLVQFNEQFLPQIQCPINGTVTIPQWRIQSTTSYKLSRQTRLLLDAYGSSVKT